MVTVLAFSATLRGLEPRSQPWRRRRDAEAGVHTASEPRVNISDGKALGRILWGGCVFLMRKSCCGKRCTLLSIIMTRTESHARHAVLHRLVFPASCRVSLRSLIATHTDVFAMTHYWWKSIPRFDPLLEARLNPRPHFRLFSFGSAAYTYSLAFPDMSTQSVHCADLWAQLTLATAPESIFNLSTAHLIPPSCQLKGVPPRLVS